MNQTYKIGSFFPFHHSFIHYYCFITLAKCHNVRCQINIIIIYYDKIIFVVVVSFHDIFIFIFLYIINYTLLLYDQKLTITSSIILNVVIVIVNGFVCVCVWDSIWSINDDHHHFIVKKKTTTTNT